MIRLIDLASGVPLRTLSCSMRPYPLPIAQISKLFPTAGGSDEP